MTDKSPSDIAGLRIREARTRKGWRVKDLADHCAKAGATQLTVDVLTNLETRRKASREITLDEVMVIAHVLDVSPMLLMLPIQDGETLKVAPGAGLDTMAAQAWIADGNAAREYVWRALPPRPERTEKLNRRRDDPLLLIRQVHVAAVGITNWKGHKPEVAVYASRLFPALDALEVLKYRPPELPEIMGILRDLGLPASLDEWRNQPAAWDEVDDE